MLIKHKKKYDFFHQPCSSFDNNCCSIYERRPERCRAFECQQLKRFFSGDITETEVLATIMVALSKVTHLRQLLQQSGKINMKKSLSQQYKKVLAEPPDASGDLKAFKVNPGEGTKLDLSKKFDQIFLQKTCFQTLNLALNRIYKNKNELLLVLERPEIPLHNNLSENDIRDYVKKRKISATTRSDTGRQARDTFLSIKKTCQKLNISFWSYLLDRLGNLGQIPPLHSLIRKTAAKA
jgi:hypothetical protein